VSTTKRRWSLKLATVAGIEIRVHATMLLLVWLMLLASSADGSAAFDGMLWLTVLFGSVLLHELAHCVVALRHGVHVSEVELLPIGGVSKMDRIPDNPTEELAIAAAGPLTSLALGACSLGLAAVVGASLWTPDLYGGSWLQRLGWLNLLLGGFNLLPALPLDGGRIFRALLERRVGPLEATHLAARAGRYFAIAMIVVGALVNLWLIIIGLFVYFASQSEEAGSIVHERLGALQVADAMIRHPHMLSVATPVVEAAALLSTTAQREFPVVDGGVYVGMVDAASLNPPAVTVGDVVRKEPSVTPSTPLDEILFLSTSAAAVAVVDDGVVVGLVMLGDVDRMARRILREGPKTLSRGGSRPDDRS